MYPARMRCSASRVEGFALPFAFTVFVFAAAMRYSRSGSHEPLEFGFDGEGPFNVEVAVDEDPLGFEFGIGENLFFDECFVRFEIEPGRSAPDNRCSLTTQRLTVNNTVCRPVLREGPVPFYLEAKQVVEGLYKIHGLIVHLGVFGNSECVVEGAFKFCCVHAAGALPGLEVEHVSEHIPVHVHEGLLDGAPFHEIDVVECVLVLLQREVLEYVADTVGILRFTVFPFGGVHHFLDPWSDDGIKMISHFYKDIFPAAFVLTI